MNDPHWTEKQMDHIDYLHDEMRDKIWEDAMTAYENKANRMDPDDINACTCGSGLLFDRLYDARGIYCCRYCDECADSARSKYRADVLTNPDYQADEQIESDY